MRLLILGGTAFLGRAIAAEAVSRGHDVTCAARGSTNGAPAPLIKIDRDDPAALAVFAGERFDGVLDVAKISYPHVRRAVEQIKTDHWTFVSSISVYAQFTNGTIDDPLLEPVAEQGDTTTYANYGGIKVASENAVRDVWGEQAFIIRAGLISGQGDVSDRFGYWPARLAGTGQVVVPEAPGQPTHHLDVRDLSRWIVDGVQQRIGGTFNAAGPAMTFDELIPGIQAIAGGQVEPVVVPDAKLLELKVNAWSGPRSLPLWVPEPHILRETWDVQPALDAGLKFSSLEQTTLNALAYERELGLDRQPRKAGLSQEDEAEVLRFL